jgi:hypothetical protein
MQRESDRAWKEQRKRDPSLPKDRRDYDRRFRSSRDDDLSDLSIQR